MTNAFDSVNRDVSQKYADQKLREAFKNIHAEVREQTPSGRYQSLALTALEEAGMWAIKARTHGVQNDS